MHGHHWFGRRCGHDEDAHAHFFAGRSRFGRFGRGDDDLGGPWGGRHGGGIGRMFGHGDLKLILLALIAEQPRHGYQLIRTIEEMFGGSYAPSPGAVYPTLTMLEEMGYARVDASEAGSKKLYVVTDEGKAYLDENRDTVEALMSRMEATARAMSKMAAPMAIRQAMHTLKRALFMRGALWSETEAKRVRAIIEKAAAEITKGDKNQ